MNKLTELFCLIDDFCQQFEPLLEQRMLDSSDKQRRRRTGTMSLSEMTTIVVLFHTVRGRQFKVSKRLSHVDSRATTVVVGNQA